MESFKEKKINLSSRERKTLSSDALPNIDTRYDITANIGQGGMGEIYQAIDNENESKKVAIKVLSKELSDDKVALKRFEKEIEAVTKLDHPNLVTVLNHGTTEDGRPYLVMDYIEGETLSDFLKDGKSPKADLINIFIQVLDALEVAHNAGVVHHDLKPSNIILTYTDNSTVPVPKIIDFGIAKFSPQASSQARETHNLTNTNDGILGTPLYMSPEQCLGFKLDERADIYSFGCIMYEAITGSPPFCGENPVQIVVGHVNKTAAYWEKVDKKYTNLEDIVFKCLEKDKDNRYQTVAELKTDLYLVKEGKKVSAPLREKEPEPVYSRRELAEQFGKIICYGSYAFFISFGMLEPVVLFVFLIFYFARQHVKSFGLPFGKRKTKKNWAYTKSICKLTLASTGVIMYLANIGLFENLPQLLQSIIVAVFILHIISAWACLVATIGLFFNRNKKESKKKTMLKFSLGMIPCLILFFFYLPATLIGINTFSKISTDDYATQNSNKIKLKTEFAKAAVATNPNNCTPIEDLNELLLKQKEGNQAIQILTDLLKKHPDSQEILRQRSMAYNSLGDTDYALKDINKALNLDEHEPKRSANLNIFDTSHTFNSSTSHLNETKGTIYLANKNYSNALKYLLKADKSSYYGTSIKEKIAISYYKSGDNNKAIEFMDKACKNGSYYGEDFLKRGILYELMGKEDLAKKDFNTVIEILKKTEDTKKNAIVERLRADRYTLAQIPRDLARAYAYKKIGNQEKSAQFLKQAQDFGYSKDDLLSDFCTNLEIKLKW